LEGENLLTKYSEANPEENKNKSKKQQSTDHDNNSTCTIKAMQG